jgi:hypothetical protein
VASGAPVLVKVNGVGASALLGGGLASTCAGSLNLLVQVLVDYCVEGNGLRGIQVGAMLVSMKRVPHF